MFDQGRSYPMNNPTKNGFSNDSGSGEGLSPAEATLRLIAQVPAPAGLEDRVHARLRVAPRQARVLAWPVPRASEWMRAAAAAAIVCVVAGGGWGVYSRVQQPGQGVVAPHGAGAFSTGDAMRKPLTLQGPVVAHPVTTAPKPKPKAQAKTAAAPTTKAVAASKAAAQASPTAVPVVAR
jgi:Tfp pilus assembly protein FimV